jgi:polyhydroxybutyrate depolymerase
MRIRLLVTSLAAASLSACSTSSSGDARQVPVLADGSVAEGSGGIVPGPGAAPGDDAGFEASSPVATPVSGDAGLVDASPPGAVRCPGIDVWKPGDSQTITLALGDAGTRSYDVYVGSGVVLGTASPLLVNVHGLNNSPAIQAAFSQINPVADEMGFVVVYPAGLNASFNAGNCCGLSSATGVDDVDFIRAVVADAESNICIDAKRVYETGFSNGGMMAYELACNAADLFAAVAFAEGDNETNTPCNPSRPVPLAAFESLGDPVVLPIAAQASAAAWASQSDCADAGTSLNVTEGPFSCEEWSSCAAGSMVWYCTEPGGTHLPPAGSAPVIWSFLSKFSLP